MSVPAGVVLTQAESSPAVERILTTEALAFVAELERRFGERRRDLLQARVERQVRLDAGERPRFLDEPAAAHAPDWRVAPTPRALERRRVEITGPVERKMMINALNSGADAFMADLEDANSPDLGERRRRPGQPAGRGAPHARAGDRRASRTD